MLGFSYSTASLPMSTESQLREKLRKIEALFAGAGTAGERLAAEAALERVRERLTELGRQDPSIEMQFSMPDQWSRHLFLALCRRYGMRPYRYYRQRRNTVMVRAPKRFLDQVLWPEFSELDQALQAYLHQVTLRVIREEVYADASEAQEISCRRTDGCGKAARLTFLCWAVCTENFRLGRGREMDCRQITKPFELTQARGSAANDVAVAR